MEKTREKLEEILLDMHPDIDFRKEEALVDDKILDSFDLVNLVVEIGEVFDVEVTPEDFIRENFNSLERLCKMIVRLQEERG